jgi:hypothetical protein
MRFIRKLLPLLLAVHGAAFAAAPADASYTVADFERVAKIDAHLHLHGPDQAGFLRLAARDNFRALTINVDYPDFPPVAQQRQVATTLVHAHPRQVAWVATFTSAGFEAPGWTQTTLASLDAARREGAVGVKVWKNIGMDLRDNEGRLVMVDDARFDSLFTGLDQRGVVVLGHQGEPHNCWLPLDQMTVNSDREYFAAHPVYHMFLHPEMPSYAQQMAARDRWLARHPAMQFVGVHMASLEWNVDAVGAFLDAHPGATIDLAARIGQLQHQSQQDRARVRRFFIRYQDRLMYGSDLAQSHDQPDADFVADLDTVWRRDWRYFNTSDAITVPELDAPVAGLALPKTVVDKLYRRNAVKRYPAAWKPAAPG